jgi:hypothetical protein
MNLYTVFAAKSKVESLLLRQPRDVVVYFAKLANFLNILSTGDQHYIP